MAKVNAGRVQAGVGDAQVSVVFGKDLEAKSIVEVEPELAAVVVDVGRTKNAAVFGIFGLYRTETVHAQDHQTVVSVGDGCFHRTDRVEGPARRVSGLVNEGAKEEGIGKAQIFLGVSQFALPIEHQALIQSPMVVFQTDEKLGIGAERKTCHGLEVCPYAGSDAVVVEQVQYAHLEEHIEARIENGRAGLADVELVLRVGEDVVDLRGEFVLIQAGEVVAGHRDLQAVGVLRHREGQDHIVAGHFLELGFPSLPCDPAGQARMELVVLNVHRPGLRHFGRQDLIGQEPGSFWKFGGHFVLWRCF